MRWLQHLSIGTEAGKRRLLGAALLTLAVAGLLHVQYGSWRPAPGIGNHLVPMMAYLVMAAASIVLLLARSTTPATATAGERPRLVVLLVALVGSVVYVLAVRMLGIGVATVLGITLATLALSAQPRRNLLACALTGLLSGAVFWLLFTRLAPIVMPRPLLF